MLVYNSVLIKKHFAYEEILYSINGNNERKT